MSITTSSKNQFYSERARRLIPGGAHTYSKGDDQFTAYAPKIISHGKGCEVWDVDGGRFLDLAMSLGTVTLGHAYEPVLKSVRAEIERGVNFLRPSVIEGDLAEILVDLIPSAEMVKFAKNGSDAVTAAVKLARAVTGRDYIARCSSDPFNAIHDWFIGSTVVNRGVPRAVQELTLKFEYNNIESCKKLFDLYPNKISAFLLEPLSFTEPKDDFLAELKALCEKNGALLIFDEVVSGFRFSLGGAQKVCGVTPHLSAFGKAMANGFSVSALAGKKEFMKLGGLDHEEERVFLLSTTHGGETHSLAAAIATINELKKHNVVEHFYWVGKYLKNGIDEIAQRHTFENHLKGFGFDCKPGVMFLGKDGENSSGLRSLFLQELARRGVLMPYIVPSFAHKKEHLDVVLNVIDEVVPFLKRALDDGELEKLIEGEPLKPVFRKFN